MDEPVGRVGLVLARPARKINLMVYIAGGARRTRAVSPTRPPSRRMDFRKKSARRARTLGSTPGDPLLLRCNGS